MNFTTLKFWLFFAVVYVLYLILPHRWQNRLLLVASVAFYASWDWRFVPLLLFSILLTFYSGLAIERESTEIRKLRILKGTVALDIGILLVFKYFNFFVAAIVGGLRSAGIRVSEPGLHILLPLGISYYTFQAIAYTVDVYRGEIKAARRLLNFVLFKSFFPIILCGPIERAGNLLRQIESPRRISESGLQTGAALIIWGLFKKMVIASQLAVIVDDVFANYGHRTGLEAVVGVYAFAIQLYCDFSAYTDIARGMGAMMGFALAPNFNSPLFATSFVDFWRRWHISLGLWFRDYVYFPLLFRVRNLYFAAFATIFLAGVWHGASSAYVLVGFYWGILMVAQLAIAPRSRLLHPAGPGARRIVLALSIFATFQAYCLGALCLRAETAGRAIDIVRSLFGGSHEVTPLALEYMKRMAFFSAPVFGMDLVQFLAGDSAIFRRWSLRTQLACFVAIFYMTIFSHIFNPTTDWSRKEFIYYQF